MPCPHNVLPLIPAESTAYLVLALTSAYLVGASLEVLLHWRSPGAARRVTALLQAALLHAGLAYLLAGLITAWRIPVLVFFTQLILSAMYRLSLPAHPAQQQYSPENCIVHAVLQVALRVIVAVTCCTSATPLWLDLCGVHACKALLLLAGFAIAVIGGMPIIGGLVQPFLDQINPASRDQSQCERGLADGGRVIGLLERTLIFMLMLMGQPAAVGFLVTAKSIMRFGEVKDAQHRKEAEYVIIGTLASFAWCLFWSWCTQYALSIL